LAQSALATGSMFLSLRKASRTLVRLSIASPVRAAAQPWPSASPVSSRRNSVAGGHQGNSSCAVSGPSSREPVSRLSRFLNRKKLL
jgi:hypothetical protein